jgi:hypothetical protein
VISWNQLDEHIVCVKSVESLESALLHRQYVISLPFSKYQILYLLRNRECPLGFNCLVFRCSGNRPYQLICEEDKLSPFTMASITFGTKTFGEKPQKVQIEEGGECYYVGSEVWRFPFMIVTSQTFKI